MTCQGKLDICLDHLSFKNKIMVHLWYLNTIEEGFSCISFSHCGLDHAKRVLGHDH